MISRNRRKKIKQELGIMVDLAWRNAEFPEIEGLTEEEEEYAQGIIDGILKRLFASAAVSPILDKRSL